MRTFFRYVVLPGFGSLLLMFGALAAAVVWGTSPPPPPLALIDQAAAQQNLSTLPERRYARARDGVALAYRAYPGAAAEAVILVHGSTAQAETMHGLARTIAAMPDAPSVYAVDIRGHGQSGTRGDVSYVGQLEDDLADFLAVQGEAHPAARWTLIGFSAGGGFALRIAGSSLASRFSRVVLLAPMLHHEAPVNRPGGRDWVAPYLPRLIALTILDRAGLPWFQDLPVLAFARRDGEDNPYTYSYRLWRNFKARDDYAADFRNAPVPPAILVGAADEFFVAEAFPPLLRSIRADVTAIILPELNHMDMIFDERAQQAVAALLTDP